MAGKRRAGYRQYPCRLLWRHRRLRDDRPDYRERGNGHIVLEEEPKVRDEDVEAIRKAFEVMGSVVLQGNGNLQLLVLDHASRAVWGNIDGVVGLPEWRDGVKLVPMEWLSENK
ncbi:TPA: DUF3732 domain-containing protein [Klebsiella pneumoniae]|nr:DUF3732 domain-containing protein [Klebsiella pneumoniae]